MEGNQVNMAEPVAFQIPKKPTISEKDPLPDQRKVVVLPFKAVFDERLTPGSLQVLAALCAYCNRAGITWVSQARLAKELQISRQAVTNQLIKLRAVGYVEILKKRVTGQRCNTLRVIFDSTVNAETAMAITSRYEDTRPPAIKEEQDRQMYEQSDPIGQQRIAQLVSKSLRNTNPKQERIMPKSGQTRTVKEMKQAIQKAQSKGQQPVDNMATERTLKVSNEGNLGHSGVSYMETGECPITRIQQDKSYIKTVMGNEEIELLIKNEMTENEIKAAEELIAPLFAAEGLTPTSAVMCQTILQMHRDTR